MFSGFGSVMEKLLIRPGPDIALLFYLLDVEANSMEEVKVG